MNTPRPCGCKGKRSCLICEQDYNIPPHNATSVNVRFLFSYLSYPNNHTFFRTLFKLKLMNSNSFLNC